MLKFVYYSIYILVEFKSLNLEHNKTTNSSVLWSRGLNNTLQIFLSNALEAGNCVSRNSRKLCKISRQEFSNIQSKGNQNPKDNRCHRCSEQEKNVSIGSRH